MIFGRVLYPNIQVEWLSNTINRLCQLPRQVRPSAIEHKLFKHKCLKPAKIPCWASQKKTSARSWNLGARKVTAWGANKRRCVWTRKGTEEQVLFAKLLLNLLLNEVDYYPFSVLAAVGYLLCSNIWQQWKVKIVFFNIIKSLKVHIFPIMFSFSVVCQGCIDDFPGTK